MSYNFVEDGWSFYEGISIIEMNFPTYDRKQLKDIVLPNRVYSIEMVKECISKGFFNEFLRILIFDALIGNSDRHHSNWGLYTNWNTRIPYFAPLYDNGSSLCSYEEESKIDIILKDKLRFDALVDSKSKATIGFNGKRPVRHFELVEYISKLYYKQTVVLVNRIASKITDENINSILQKFSSDIMSNKRKELVRKFLKARREKILSIYGLGE